MLSQLELYLFVVVWFYDTDLIDTTKMAFSLNILRKHEVVE